MTDESIENNKDPRGLLAPRETPKRGRKKSSNRTIDIAPKSDAGELKSWVCRKCLRRRQLKDFYVATDKLLDSSGYMSICKYCIDDLYEKFYVTEKSLDKTLLRLCRLLNVKFDSVALEGARKHIETLESKGKVVGGVFGIYRKGLVGGGFERFGNRNDEDLTFQGSIDFIPNDSLYQEVDSQEDIIYFEEAWGKGLDIEDYIFLEKIYAEWTKTATPDNRGIEVLLRELCHKENEIRKARLEGNTVDSLVKGLQEIMKNSALTPALQKASASGKSAETFGSWIKEIETLTPAEWYEQQDKYRDIEGIEEYNERFVKRSIKNFITGSRDFNLEETLGLESDDINFEE